MRRYICAPIKFTSLAICFLFPVETSKTSAPRITGMSEMPGLYLLSDINILTSGRSVSATRTHFIFHGLFLQVQARSASRSAIDYVAVPDESAVIHHTSEWKSRFPALP